MTTPEEEEIIYKSGTSRLGAGWDVMNVYQRSKGSFTLARNMMDGTIMRMVEPVPERWEVIRDEEMLRVARQAFDDRDKARERKAGA